MSATGMAIFHVVYALIWAIGILAAAYLLEGDVGVGSYVVIIGAGLYVATSALFGMVLRKRGGVDSDGR